MVHAVSRYVRNVLDVSWQRSRILKWQATSAYRFEQQSGKQSGIFSLGKAIHDGVNLGFGVEALKIDSGKAQNDKIMAEAAQLRQRKVDGEKKQENGSQQAKKTNGVKSSPSSGISESMNKLLGLVALALTLGLLFRENIQHYVNDIPAVIPFLKPAAKLPADTPRRDAVVDAFKHAWHAYERDAMGSDEYHPIAHKGSNLTSAGGIGYMVADSIDTMHIMGLKDEYQRARDWIANKMSFDRNAEYNAYQVTSRVLGGLLSAYELSNHDPIFLEKAKELGDRLLPAFDTPFGIPNTRINLGRSKGIDDANNIAITSEATGVQLEYRQLSHLTGKKEYQEKAHKVFERIRDNKLSSGQSSIFLAVDNGKFMTSQARVGSRSEAFYEYLLKQSLQTCDSDPMFREMYREYIDVVEKTLIKKSMGRKLSYLSEIQPKAGRRGYMNWFSIPRQDYAGCFLGGNLLLGATTVGSTGQPISIPPKPEELTKDGKRDWDTGLELIETCVDFYKGTKTGLAPEIVKFRTNDDGLGSHGGKHDWYIEDARAPGQTPPYDARYVLRPETIESLFIAYRLTGDQKYRDYGWEIFQAIEKHCKVESGGYAGITNVDDVNSKKEDKMETFLMSETFKYLYLLFSDSNTIPLDKYVFSTEAHPLPKFGDACKH